MAVTIRMQRHGTTHRPFYHIVATDKRNARNSGSYLERLGYYDPGLNPSLIELKQDRVQYWYENGAEMSSAVANLLKAKKVTVTRKTKT